MKKAISVLLAIAIVLALIPAGLMTVSAASAFGFTDDFYYYGTTNSLPYHTEIYQMKSRVGAVTVPSTLWGQPVTVINSSGFSHCSGITSITLPDTLTTIMQSTFKYCTGLTSIFIPDTVTSIGGYAFDGCTNLSSIHLPTGLTGSIGSYTFRDTALTEIFIPAGVTSIDINSFLRCASLTAINVDENNQNYSSHDGVLYNKAKTTLLCCPAGKSGAYSIPAGVTKIDTKAFLNCTELTSVTIPSSVNSIHTGTAVINSASFVNNPKLTQFIVDSNNNTYSNYLSDNSDGILFNKAKTNIVKYPQGKAGGSYDIPSAVTAISSYAFDGCSQLTSINFTAPVNVTSVGTYAFRGCTGLTSFAIPTGVTTIQNYAFSGCIGLTSVTIPANATTINEGAFYGCTGLTGVNIPGKVATLGKMAFQACTAMTAITVDGTNTKFSTDADGILFNPTKTTLIQYPCGKSGSYSVPSSVTTISEYAFQFCDKLTSVSIPTEVTSIVTGMPGENGQIGYDGNRVMFSGCSALTAIDVSGDNPNYSSLDGVLFNKLKTVLYKVPGGKSGTYAIPAGVTTLDHSAFMGCAGLTAVNIPNSVTTINKCVFQNCTGLTSVTIPASVTTIGDYAFMSCQNLEKVLFLGSAPIMGSSYYRIFDDNAVDRLIYYREGKASAPASGGFKGFSDPWYGASTALATTFTASSVTGKTGSNVTVTLSITGNSNAGAATILIPYDSSKLAFVSAVAGTALTGTPDEENPANMFSIHNVANSHTNLTFINVDGLNAAGSILQITYTILQSADGAIPVVPTVQELCDIEGTNITYTVTNGEIVVDNTGPIPATFAAAPTTPTNGNVTVTITYPGDAAVKQYKVDGGDWTDYTAPVVLEENATVYAQGQDAAGNWSDESSISITNIDKVAPVVEGVVDGAQYMTDRTITFNEGTATLNASAFASGATVSDEGAYTLIVTDAAGNVTTVGFIIDKTAPVVTGVTNGAYYNAPVTITFNEGTATLNGSAFSSGTTVSDEGAYTLIVTDTAGNVTTVAFVIDLSAPAAATFIPSTTAATSSLTVTINYPGDAAIKQYSYNGIDWFGYTTAVPVAVVSSKDPVAVNRRVYARCFDAAGNPSPMDNYVDLPNIVMLGDVSLDDYVSVIDALKALQSASGKYPLTLGNNNYFAADANSNGTVTAFDALRILQFASGRILSF